MSIKTHKGKKYKAYEKICSTNISHCHHMYHLYMWDMTELSCQAAASMSLKHICAFLLHAETHAGLWVPCNTMTWAAIFPSTTLIQVVNGNESMIPGGLGSEGSGVEAKQGTGRRVKGGRVGVLGSLKVKACWRKALLATVFASKVWRSEHLRSLFKSLTDSNSKIAYWWEKDEHTWTRIYVYVNACICTCKYKDVI